MARGAGDSGDFSGFEWDVDKNNATFAARGVDFAAAAKVFEGDHVEREDTRRDDGERRFVVTGEVADVVVTLGWTPRGRFRRIIAAWPASNREGRAYRDHRAAHE